MITVACGVCGTNMNIDSQLIGHAVHCPYCSGTIHLPKRTPKTTIIARWGFLPMLAVSFWAIFLGWPLFIGGLIGFAVYVGGAWAITNIGGAIWCKLSGDGSYEHLKMWKAGGGDPFFDTLDGPLNNDPPSVRFQELYRAKQRQETVAVNRQFGLPDDFMTNGPATPAANDIPGIDDPNLVL